MSLLRDIQNSAIDAHTDIQVVLRKCKVLAARLNNEKFEKWVESELLGYQSIDSLPKYRIFRVESYGNFHGPFGSGRYHAIMPIGFLPITNQDFFRYSYLLAPISNYSDLLQQEGDGNILENWPAEAVVHFGGNFYKGMYCSAAWKQIPRNCLAAMIDTVRNRVLNFVIEIEKEAPDAGEAPLSSPLISDEKVNQVFHTHIYGNVENLSSGGSNFNQIGEVKSISGNVDALLSYLANNKVPQEDLGVLQEAITEDENADQCSEGFGPKVTQWMAKMLNKAGSGTWKIGVNAASTLLSKALCEYYGFS